MPLRDKATSATAQESNVVPFGLARAYLDALNAPLPQESNDNVYEEDVLGDEGLGAEPEPDPDDAIDPISGLTLSRLKIDAKLKAQIAKKPTPDRAPSKHATPAEMKQWTDDMRAAFGDDWVWMVKAGFYEEEPKPHSADRHKMHTIRELMRGAVRDGLSGSDCVGQIYLDPDFGSFAMQRPFQMKTMWNDVVELYGKRLQGAVTNKNTLQYHYDDDLAALPDDFDFVQRLLSENQTSWIVGPTGSGKTFFVLDLALHIAQGKNWHGRKVEKRGVIYIALEGVGGIKKRYNAYRKKHGITTSLPIAFGGGSFDVRNNTATRDSIIALARDAAKKWGIPVGWIVIDTLHRGMGGGDENSAGDMGAFRESMDYIREATGANVGTIHHTGKDVNKGGRGSNSIGCDLDMEIVIDGGGDEAVSVARLTKQKDGEKALLGAFELEVVKLGYTDHWGVEATSCVVKWTDLPKAEAKLPPSEAALLAILSELAGVSHEGVAENELRDACMRDRRISGSDNPGSRKSIFNRAYRELTNKGRIEVRRDKVFLVVLGTEDFDNIEESD